MRLGRPGPLWRGWGYSPRRPWTRPRLCLWPEVLVKAGRGISVRCGVGVVTTGRGASGRSRAGGWERAEIWHGCWRAVIERRGVTAPGAVVPPAVSTGEDNRLPIFESVESDWFRRGRHGAARSVSAASPGSAGWSSPADDGWRAAEVAHAPVIAGTTVAGLPKRVPKANLVPGGVGMRRRGARPPRSAALARERLASFQRASGKRARPYPGMKVRGSGEADDATQAAIEAMTPRRSSR